MEKNDKGIYAFKSWMDTRYNDNFITSHGGLSFKCTRAKSPSLISHIMLGWLRSNRQVDIIAIDECQFFDPYEMSSFANEWAVERGFNVVCAGLSQDADGNPFGAMPYLLSTADNIIKLNGRCLLCEKVTPATRTYSNIDLGGELRVGGSEIYEPRCFNCWRYK